MKHFRVVDLSRQTLFDDECRRLAEAVTATLGVPNVIVGIEHGGAIVARRMLCHLHDVELMCVAANRPSTRTKRRLGGIMRIVGMMPRCVRDAMRVAEARMLSRRGNSERRVTAIDINAGRLATPGLNVLVVDDAVDSGHTMAAVLSELRRVAPNARLMSAVVTVTTSTPCVKPDVALYDNLTLVRFPWSIDA